jgi:hypothetical protein
VGLGVGSMGPILYTRGAEEGEGGGGGGKQGSCSTYQVGLVHLQRLAHRGTLPSRQVQPLAPARGSGGDDCRGGETWKRGVGS